MLAIRYGLMYPEAVDQLVLVDPIGLEDWKTKGVPWQSVDGWYRQELRTNADGIRAYERSTYYAGTWDPAMSAGCRCWPACIAAPDTLPSPGTRPCSTT